ncbi:NapC/NirT family cytochrome c [Kaarinaea lacus]
MYSCPSKKTICIGLVVFFVGGISFAGLNTFFNYTNDTEFCISCHSMNTNYEEYKETLHYKNASGVRAGCADCHVPRETGPKFVAKIIAARDVFYEIIGTIDTPEKFQARRWDMANTVWDRMRSNDSRECRSCHRYEVMDASLQESRTVKKHSTALEKGKTCIDCHSGIAHEEPLEPD